MSTPSPFKTSETTNSADTAIASRSNGGLPECDSTSDGVDYPPWRLEELARKYAPEDAYEPNEVNE